ncbi:hypothetical protein DRN74_06535 [Candidatus Micrarchaeota archaeon]|nr:MAG: hypothetical protein DRN74_06535 [Candidatus Micrarchaeota archaeon]
MNLEHEFVFWTKRHAFDVSREKRDQERLAEHANFLARTRRLSLEEATLLAAQELGYRDPERPNVGPGHVLAHLADALADEEAIPLDEALQVVYEAHPQLVELEELWREEHELVRAALRRLGGTKRLEEAETADDLAHVILEEIDRLRAREEVGG